MTIAYICSPRVYEFAGWVFEYGGYGTPWPLKKNGDPRERAGRIFWHVITTFEKLSQEERQEYYIGGGCERLEW
jgi:hypothetical protein